MLILESILLGINNGLAPGALSSWVACEALQGNTKSFVKISIAPIMFGLIIVPLIFVFVALLHNNPLIIGSIAMAGAIFLVCMGINQLYTAKKAPNIKNTPKNEIFIKSTLVNFCNPYGYIFWLSIGIPLINRAAHTSLAFAGIIAVIYYFTLVSVKLCLGVLIQFFNSIFNLKCYKKIIQIMGIIFIFFGMYYMYYAVHLLK